ncbi:cysteine dioxygenase family protein [Thermomonas fusca]|uniref:cysteine dioxygenase family protein n=2 Tax=Thermomonas TaxID=141948 RepID=UPI0006890550|nr:cysteine dioxygenase family protein [Thermomonas fusca]
MLDAAVALGGVQAVTAALRDALTALIVDPGVCLPDYVHAPMAGHYARRELYRSPEHGYSVVAMTWAPGQGTPLHDHDGRWCVEGVWQGQLDIVQYELVEKAGERLRFRVAGRSSAGPGSAGSLIPPHEYHTIHNADPDHIAVSVHVYQAPLESCASFCPQEDGWFVRESTRLAIDEAA